MDLLTVLKHDLGHLLGFHYQETGVMEDTLAEGTRKTRAVIGASRIRRFGTWHSRDTNPPCAGDFSNGAHASIRGDLFR